MKHVAVNFAAYGGTVQAVRDISFSIEEGQTVALVGESGCGKSITAKTIMGLVKKPGKVMEGSQIIFEGTDIAKYSSKEWKKFRGKECSMIFQDALVSLNPTMKIGKQIQGLRAAPLGGRPGQLPQAVPGGRIQRHVRADHRPAQGIHRQENLAERRPARLRRIGIDMIHRIEETTSTNDDARDAKYRHGDIVWAERQTAGRGQRGHKWSSAEGLNLTFSLVLEPRFLPAGEQFLLNEAVALALTDTFAQFGIAARIKWTNDIYAGDKKLVGILIEHSYSGQTLARTIVGIGINVNQTEFDPALPNPVSMAMVAVW